MNPSSLLDIPYIKDSKVFQQASNLYQKGKVIAEKVKNTVINPASTFISNKYTQVFDKVKETKTFGTLKNAYDKGKNLYKNVQ